MDVKMFSWLNKKSPSENEILGAKMIETLKKFRGESKSVMDLFLQQAAVLHMNFKGKYESVEKFRAQSDKEKGEYFTQLLNIENPTLRTVPAIKLAYAFYHCLIWLEEASMASEIEKLRIEYRFLRKLSQDRS